MGKVDFVIKVTEHEAVARFIKAVKDARDGVTLGDRSDYIEMADKIDDALEALYKDIDIEACDN